MIESRSVEEVKARIDIVDVIANYIELKKSGANFKANCPFHGENTPSFVISPSKQIYKCFGCLPPFQEISTPKGFIKIKDIKVGDEVFSVSGSITKVIKTLNHKSNYDILGFRTSLSHELSYFTQNHNMLVVSKKNAFENLPYIRTEKNRPLRFYGNIKKRRHIKPYHISFQNKLANNIQNGDYFLYPVDREIKADKILNVSHLWKSKRISIEIKKINTIKLNKNFMWLAGMYVAEGSSYRGGIKFSLSAKEENFAKKIIKIIKKLFNKQGKLFYPKNRNNSLEVTISSTNLQFIFEKLFNKGAENKCYPYWFNYLNKNLREELFKGLMDGDGCYSRNTYDTISHKLANEILDLAISLYKIPTCSIHQQYKDKHGVNHKKSYTIYLKKRESLESFFEKIGDTTYLFSKIKEIKNFGKEDQVYDITVKDKSHTFLAKHFVVGNCGEGGDAIKFVMEYEKLTYPESIEKLADQFGIHLQYTDNHQDNFHDKKILENFNLFLRKQLEFNAEAKKYLLGRGLYDSSIEKFELGYAPQSNLTLDFLRQNNVPLNEALELGLVANGENNRVYARFTNRVIFPIFTPAGKIVGFGGRIITQRTDIGKYINSPQGKIFDKSTLLYGYHKAKTSIMQKGEVIVVEGNLDVIMLHQAGFTNSVATLGTALTDKHVPILVRGNPKIILAYDGDQAGINAAFKAAYMLSHRGLQGGVVIFAEGVDPADMIKNRELDEINKLFHQPKPLIEFCLEHISKQYNLANPMQKEEALKETTIYLKNLSPLLQEEYKGYLSAILNIRENLIEIGSPSPQSKKQENKRESRTPQQTNRQNTPREDIAELTILKTLLAKPHLIDFILDVIDDNIFQIHKEEFQSIIKNQMDDSKIIGIQIRENIVILEEEELKNQLLFMLRRNCENELIQIKNMRNISLTQKSFMIRKVREKLTQLKRGKFIH